MATRPVFAPHTRKNKVQIHMLDFSWNAGLSASQKRKNIAALHEAYRGFFPEQKVLEISSKSLEPLGVSLSAFNLTKFVPELGRTVPVECIYQGSKVFAAGGPYPDLYTGTARAAKGDPRLKSSGELRGFRFGGRDFPLRPVTAFYNWIYINALLEHPELASQLTEYGGFTDIAFNPSRSLNCQAEAAALYVTLSRKGLTEQCRDFDSFLRLLD